MAGARSRVGYILYLGGQLKTPRAVINNQLYVLAIRALRSDTTSQPRHRPYLRQITIENTSDRLSAQSKLISFLGQSEIYGKV